LEYHYEYSTYNSHHKLLVDLQASSMDASPAHQPTKIQLATTVS